VQTGEKKARKISEVKNLIYKLVFFSCISDNNQIRVIFSLSQYKKNGLQMHTEIRLDLLLTARGQSSY